MERICCPLTMMSHKRFFKNGSKAVISMPFLSNFLFSYVFIFEMAMIAVHFCPHSTAGLNEPFITNFLSFGCSWCYFLCIFFNFIFWYYLHCIAIIFIIIPTLIYVFQQPDASSLLIQPNCTSLFMLTLTPPPITKRNFMCIFS